MFFAIAIKITYHSLKEIFLETLVCEDLKFLVLQCTWISITYFKGFGIDYLCEMACWELRDRWWEEVFAPVLWCVLGYGDSDLDPDLDLMHPNT